MKLFLALCALSFSAVSMAAPVADRGLGTRKMEEVPEEGYYEEGYTGEGYEVDDAVALTDEEIEALFEQDMLEQILQSRLEYLRLTLCALLRARILAESQRRRKITKLFRLFIVFQNRIN